MGKRHGKRISRKIMIVTLCIPMLLCAVIILDLVFDFIKFAIMDDNAGELSIAILENINRSHSLTLSLIGIAISVWIGLNLYNVLSKEELRSLLKQAEHAAEITQRVYTEVLISKFRLFSGDGTTGYLASRLEIIDKLPDAILEKLIELEDTFIFSYKLYADRLPTVYNNTGVQHSEQLIKIIDESKENGEINSEQHSFLMGYISLRWGDFTYFRAQCEGHSEEGKDEFARCIIKRYKYAVFNLFGLRDITLCTMPELYLPQERQGIAFLANNIGSAHLLFMSRLNDEDLNYVIAAEKVAVAFSNEVTKPSRAMFVRNLGVAYERKGEMYEAFKQYCKAFQLNCRNENTAHCIASWYRKQVYKRFPELSENLIITEDQISSLDSTEKNELLSMLKQSAYWYEFKRGTNGGKVEDWLITLHQCMYKLTEDNELKEKLDMLCQEKEYHCAVLDLV